MVRSILPAFLLAGVLAGVLATAVPALADPQATPARDEIKAAPASEQPAASGSGWGSMPDTKSPAPGKDVPIGFGWG